MKVISGLYKGRKIDGFDIAGTRPTMDRVKESLFAMIQDFVGESTVLDLFAGSGNLGIEALSEGAERAYFVDSNKTASSFIKKNIRTIGIENAFFFSMDYKMALKKFADEKIIFDLIFLDPPYKTNYIETSLKLIDEYHLLNDLGIVVCESDDLNKIVFPDGFCSFKEKKYGDKYIVLLRKM